MKVLIPENISDITLKQFQDFVALDKVEGITNREVGIEKLKIFLGFTDEQIEAISITDFNQLSKLIDEALNKPSEFQQRFEMDGIEFGFHPNLDRMTTAEYVDLMNYNSDPETLHKLMAILFRPITNKDAFGNYSIAEYNGTKKYSDLMKEIPLNICDGALFFFINLSIELQNFIQKSMEEEQKREM